MRTNRDISGQLSKAVDNASIFVPPTDKAVTESPDNKQEETENSDIPQPIDTEFEMEYQAEETAEATEEPEVTADEIEAEEIACYMGNGEPEMAQGITLGELAQMVQVIQVEQSTETEERQAVQTICRTETNLLHSMVEQINGGITRVAELLQKHEQGNHVSNCSLKTTDADTKLYLAVSVKQEGYFNGTINLKSIR